MKTKTRLFAAVIATSLIASPGVSVLFAADAPPQGVVAPAVLINTLEEAYTVLAKADHDYHGHRVEAMKEIAEAARILGKDISGNGKGGEHQAFSDLEIRSVQMSLVGVGREMPRGAERREVVTHLNAAVGQLSEALAAEDAAPAAEKPSSVTAVNAVGTNSVEVASLERIYEVLTGANHDYKGHRVKAMEAIRKACNALGGHISGDARDKEKQSASDQQLRQSEHLLKQVRDAFATNDPKSVLKDLNVAVDELTTALEIK